RLGIVENAVRFLGHRIGDERVTAAIGSVRGAAVGSTADMKDLAPIHDHGHAVSRTEAAHLRPRAIGAPEGLLPFGKALVYAIRAEDFPRHVERGRAMIGS